MEEKLVDFLYFHTGSVRGVAFSPVDRYIFCSGAYDGKVNLYNAMKGQHLASHQITTLSLARNINGVRFTGDGQKVLATTTVRRLVILDVESGEQVFSYDNCTFNGRDRTAITVGSENDPNLVACTSVNGKGLSVFDLRRPLPIEFINELHDGIVRDIIFLPVSWPWCKGKTALLSAAENGSAKVTTLEGQILHTVNVDSLVNTMAITPEKYGSMADDGFNSLVMFGGKYLTTFVPDVGVQECMVEHGDSQLWKIRYTSNGHYLFTACDKGIVRKYRRLTDCHEYQCDLFKHNDDIEDMDISPYDEFLVTASKDRSVGIYHLGAPNHGSTGYKEIR